MTNTFFCSDHHFGHKGIITFKDDEDQLLRPFATVEEHDEMIIANHNAIVGPQDRVYMMGDLAINRSSIQKVGRLNGRKKLIKGNHDIFKLKDYLPYFDDIGAYRFYPDSKLIVSHIPIHTDNLYRFKFNAHGHTHANFTKLLDGTPDPRYFNLCLEKTDFKPVSFDDLKKRMEQLNDVE